MRSEPEELDSDEVTWEELFEWFGSEEGGWVRMPDRLSWDQLADGVEPDPRKAALDTFFDIAPGAVAYMSDKDRRLLMDILRDKGVEAPEDTEARAIRHEAEKYKARKRGEKVASDQMAEEDAIESGIDPEADWTPIPLDEVDGSPLAPQYGLRDDYARCFYKGKLNLVFGESESGKTWLALLAAYQVVDAGGHVVVIDFEDSAESIKSRLSLLGMLETEQKRILYLNPASAITDKGRAALAGQLADAELCIIDATSEGMAAYGLSSNSDVDVAEFYAALPKWVARQGPAVVLIDHTPKSADNRGGPQGSQHKRAGVDGASMYVENVEKFGPGKGLSRVWVNKDKHAGVRANAHARGLWADLKCEDVEGFVLRVPDDPTARKLATVAARSLAIDEAIGQIVEEHDGELISFRAMRDALRDRGVSGRNETFQSAYKAFRDERG